MHRLSFLFVLLLISPAHAQNRLQAAVGGFDVLDDDVTGEFRLEYYWDNPFLWKLSPFVGGMVTADSGLYGYAGVFADFDLGEGFHAIPSFAPGVYDDGNGKDLGYGLEFRSQLEVAYAFDNGARWGLSFSHMSNASLGDENPGAESVMLNYSIPFRN